jgi:methylated-DNA-protein-cysteine methyltransferase-like protein
MIYSMTLFQEQIHKAVQKIPKGKVATYGQIARLAGRPKAARAVGMCMSCNTDTKKTPCHRVVGSTGVLTGYAFGGPKKKKEILEKEGVQFKGTRVDLKLSKWKA